MKLLILFLISSLSAETKNLKISNEILDQIKVEYGGIVLMEQNLKKHHQFSNEDSYTMQFFCEKKTSKSKTRCKLIKYNVYNKVN